MALDQVWWQLLQPHNNRMQSDFGELALASAADAGVMRLDRVAQHATLIQ